MRMRCEAGWMSVAEVARIPRLRGLELQGTKASPAPSLELVKLPSVRSLRTLIDTTTAFASSVTREVVQLVGRLHSLRSLDIGLPNHLAADHLAPLSQLPLLTKLAIRFNNWNSVHA